jgi:ABC-type multidrug transport system ATPase subunit
MVEIALERVERSFGDRVALAGITATIAGGERWLVRGPNGSGKTTLLKIVAGLIGPTGGRVVFREGDTVRDAAWRRHALGYVSPDLVLYEEFSLLENLEFFGKLRGLPPDTARDTRLLERVGVGTRVHDRLGTLSTGMHQRVKIAFAVQTAPQVLLLDEPGSNLDAPGRALVEEIVHESAGRGAAVVIASNDPSEFPLGTRVLELG